MTSPVHVLAPPQSDIEARRYADYFRRNGVSAETLLRSVELTFARTEVFLEEARSALAKAGRFQAACGPGCAWCCHTMVSLLAPEAFYLARHIETAMAPDAAAALKARVIAHDRANRGKSGGARLISRIACAMLDPQTRLCRVHGARPLTCRALHSADLSACRTAFESRDPYRPAPSHSLFHANTQAYYDAFGASLAEAGLWLEPLELHAALATIWTTDDALNRWIAGEAIFPPDALMEAASTDAPPPHMA